MEDNRLRRQFGLWESPITPRRLAVKNELIDIGWDQNGCLVWLERRGPRSLLVVQQPDGNAPRDLTSDLSARGRLGYGGGEFTVGGGSAFFVEAESGRIFRQPLSAGLSRPVTSAFGGAASPALSPDGRWLIYLHTDAGRDSLAVVDSQGKFWPQKLVEGDDFYAQPVWSQRGDQIAFVSWNHPQMPWDGTLLRLGRLETRGRGLPEITDLETVAGDAKTAIFQPAFSPDGRFLAYVSDESGWWQIYLHELGRGDVRQLTREPAEHGLPSWVQGLRTYAFSPDGRNIYVLRNQNAVVSLWRVEIDSGKETQVPIPDGYTELEQVAISPDGEWVAVLASGDRIPQRLITIRSSDGLARIHARATSEELPPDTYAESQPVSWQSESRQAVYGLFYPPHSPRYTSPGRPPLLVLIHGGPTGQHRAGFDDETQFFTSRGYAVLQVNFRGSTGYGRTYRDSLRGAWGLVDVEDAIGGARHVIEQGLVDAERMAIIGGSSGGLTVLKALEDYPGFFRAGVGRYPVSDHFALAAEIHKFEAHYSDSLLGVLPEAADLYRERSPIFFANRIQDPVAIFQGGVDPVVPKEQTDKLVETLNRQGVPNEYYVYPEEGHGFRKAETIEHYYETVEAFLRRYLVFG